MRKHQIPAAVMLAAIAFTMPVGPAHAQGTAADALADRFAGVAEADAKAKAAAKAAAEAILATQAKAAEDEKRIIAAKKAADLRAAADATRLAEARAASDKAAADARLKQEEADMLARARAETVEPRSEPAAAAASAASPAPPTDAAANAGSDSAEAVRRAAIDAEVQRRVREAERQAELDTLTDKIRRAQTARPGATAPVEPTPERQPEVKVATPPPVVTPQVQPETKATLPIETKPVQPSQATAAVSKPEETRPAASKVAAPAAMPSQPAPLSAAESRVTLLLVMDPGHAGIRRNNPSADPILCMREICYISRGTDADAIALPRQRAFGPINTLGPRAGACSNQLGCVFRNIDLGGAMAVVQPVDLRLIKHDRRETSEVRVDLSCAVRQSRLTCSQTTRGPDYRLWAVPESISANAGSAALMAAVHAGLPTP